MSRIASYAAGVLAAGLLFGCADAKSRTGGPDAGSGPAVSFATDIHPILVAKCGASGCHATDNIYQPGHGAANVDEAYQATQNMALAGGFVYERILVRVSGADQRGFMPPTCSGPVGAPGCVTDDELALIRAWVAQGAPP